jgi:hypothetical protein
MRRSLLRYTHALLLPLLAVGLVLTGCDSSGSNGDDGSDNPSYSTDGSYAEQVSVNVLAFDLGVRTGSNGVSNNSKTDLIDLYEGNNLGAQTLPSGLSGSPEQSTYGDLATVDVSSLVSTDNLKRGDQLEPSDTPNDGMPVDTDELLRYYFQEAGNNDVAVTANGIVISQFAEKMLLGTPIYGAGAEILNDFANGTVSSNQAAQWDQAFGYFGFPKTLEPFLDYSAGGEGLAGGPAQDLDGNGSIDLESEYAYTWAQYAIERSATAENENDFARRAFEALVDGREAIENGNDPSDHAETALRAWEEVVAVNVIHYLNSMIGDLKDDNTDVSEGDFSEDAWGEAKAFAWGLQFYSRSALSSTDLNTILDQIGNDPPYGEMTEGDYLDALQSARSSLQSAYGFDQTNVENW